MEDISSGSTSSDQVHEVMIKIIRWANSLTWMDKEINKKYLNYYPGRANGSSIYRSGVLMAGVMNGYYKSNDDLTGTKVSYNKKIKRYTINEL